MEWPDDVGLLWAKTWRRSWLPNPVPGSWHGLIPHGWDSSQAAGWLWSHLISPQVRRLLATDLAGGEPSARRRLIWLASHHDLGKATPPFQAGDPDRRAELADAGLPLPQSAAGGDPHGLLSGRLLFDYLVDEHEWPEETAEFAALTVAGHHGKFPVPDWLDLRLTHHPGRGRWRATRNTVISAWLKDVGGAAALDDWAASVPTIGAQLVQAGAVTLADWIASNEHIFPHAWRVGPDYHQTSAQRIAHAPTVLGIHNTWTPSADDPSPAASPTNHYQSRFGHIAKPRPVQIAAWNLARNVTGPGLLLIEAPMGEGKTEAALVAAELLAQRLGANGVFYGQPTQATANQAFGRILAWLESQGADTTVALIHGKASRQEDYRRLKARPTATDEPGLITSSWIEKRNRALLAPIVVATVDQLLLAALASRFVSLRMFGLAGKVVILDEVHAYDTYMSGLLQRVLAWLGACGVPVVLLSATLPSQQRAELLTAYTGRHPSLTERPAYPRVTWVAAPGHNPDADQQLPPAADPDRFKSVPLRWFPDDDDERVAVEIQRLLAAGASVLVIRNTVTRAHQLWERVRRTVGDDAVTVMHARFTVADRRRLENILINRFGSTGQRPAKPQVVIATQVLEQALDVSFDSLITDLCPIDLLLQRLGRVDRYPVIGRDGAPVSPEVVITGCRMVTGRPPVVPTGSAKVYGKHLLWRTAAVLHTQPAIQLPQDISPLVDAVYDTAPVGPAEWHKEMLAAAQDAEHQRRRDLGFAESVSLPWPADTESLADIHHRRAAGGVADEEDSKVQALVRLGSPTLEVLLLRGSREDVWAQTVSDGNPVRIPLDQLPDSATVETVLDQAVRLPGWSQKLTEAATTAAFTPTPWKHSTWLGSALVLLLPPGGGPLRLNGFELNYTPLTGLTVST